MGDSKSFEFIGTFFSQQNNLTHVCAHAALRTAINSSPLYGGPKLTNSQINTILSIDHVKERVGKYDLDVGNSGGGLTSEQIQSVVKHLGFGAHFADFEDNPVVDYVEYIYPLIEAGCPVILGIGRPGIAHVLAVVGHTINSDRWTPEARRGYGGLPLAPYISASAWADHFIVADDNFGMYVTLPAESVRNITVPKYNNELHAAIAVGVIPKNITIPGYHAEQLTTWFLSRLIHGTTANANNRWFQLLKQVSTGRSAMVCRTLLQDKASYIKIMSSVVDGRGHRLTAPEINALAMILPDMLWVTEVSVPNLLIGNKHKLGDFILKADASDQEFKSGDCVAFGWLPGMAWFGPGLTIGPLDWSLLGHIEVIRGAGQARPDLEW